MKMPKKNTKNIENIELLDSPIFFHLSEEKTTEEPKKGRRNRKPNEKEILRTYQHELIENENEKENTNLYLHLYDYNHDHIHDLIHNDNNDLIIEEKNENKKKEKKTVKKEEKENKKEYTKQNYENFAYLSPKERAAFEKKFTVPKNPHQEMYCKLLKTKSKKIVIANGPAGTGKTLFATEYGIRYFLTDTYEKLIFTRPSVSVDEDLGFLPGTLEEKMAPWVRPIYDVLYNFLSPKEVQQLMEDKIIEIAPLGYMRGRTFKNAWIVADEMQNSTISQMKMLLTRLGENSRLVVTGDLQQFDRSFENNGLDDFLRKLSNKEKRDLDLNLNLDLEKQLEEKKEKSIVSFEFKKGDIQREEVVKEVLDIYEFGF
jgi:phosphate starvation-inducible PhoH-like protein